MRRLARPLGTLLVIAGLGIVAWAGVTWAWEDPFTALLTKRAQDRLAEEYERRIEAFGGAQLVADGARSRAAARYRRGLRPGDPIGRLRIPRLGLTMMVVQGTDDESLKKGPGRYRGSFLPGEGELIYIAGHRTTYGAPFARIDALRPGDSVVLRVPYGAFRYRVTGHRIVAATDVGVLRSRHREVLALQACHPRFFASHRYIVYATPIDR
jgi:sortase A